MKSSNTGLRTLAAFALSAVLCLSGLLLLASCGDSDDTASATEPAGMEMKGFFLSVNADGNVDCQTETLNVILSGDESTGRVDVTIPWTAGAAFEQEGGHVGQKVIETDSSGNVTKTIITSYTARNEGVFERPGAYYLVSTENENIVGPEEIYPPIKSTIFVGFWTGEPWRTPADPMHSEVVCPYVLVPSDAGNNTPNADEAVLTCGDPMKNYADMSPGLKDYLGPNPPDATRNLGHCYKLFDSERKFMMPKAVN